MAQKIVIYSDVDGYQVVRGFADATIDPMETIAGIQDKILALPELAQLNDHKAKITAQAETAMNYFNLSQAAKAAGNLTQAETYYNLALAAQGQQKQLEEGLDGKEGLPQFMAAYAAAKLALFEANAVYSHPGPGSALLTDAQHEALSAKFTLLAAHQQLTLTGDVVADYRDATYWLKASGTWKSAAISKLGESLPASAILAANLTPAQLQEIADQVEAARVQAMSDSEKLTEAQAKQVAAKTAAAAKYTEELIAGTDAATALSDSQASYKTALAEINAKYGASLV